MYISYDQITNFLNYFQTLLLGREYSEILFWKMTAAHSTVFVLYAVCVYSLCAQNVHRYSIAVNDSISLHCSQEQKEVQWKFQENLLFIGGFLLRDEFSKSLSLAQNNALYIYPITLLHIGKYECFKTKETISTFFIDVEGLLLFLHS